MADEESNSGLGCLGLIGIIVIAFFVLAMCSSAENEEWCDSVEEFWADGNQYDSTLDDEYAMQC